MEMNNAKISAFLQKSYCSTAHLIKNIVAQFYCCDLCKQPSDKYSLLCSTCYQDISRFNLARVNGNLLNHPKISKHLPCIHFQQLIALAPYCWPYTRWVSELKYQHRFELAPLLAKMLVQHIKQANLCDELPKLLISVPIHYQRLKVRQFNQAALIAKHTAKELGCIYDETTIIRQCKTDSQVGQSGANRRRNLKGAFAIDKPKILPAHVGIVDDVVTTGATVSEISKLLTQHGVKKITVLSVCLTIPVPPQDAGFQWELKAI
ncbi:ComF family protein [Thalassotalea nanhaiensis]|uniref:ComF family protein n=1 Tax=Thalassotalea nanhaiensis TaxID=3065648 RepID=A0ABY9TKC6_9GAMM|nr:ComF family protein [Colwelliaceae bacterium SQ345]